MTAINGLNVSLVYVIQSRQNPDSNGFGWMNQREAYNIDQAKRELDFSKAHDRNCHEWRILRRTIVEEVME